MRLLVLMAAGLFFSFATRVGFGQAQRALLSVDGLNVPDGGALAAFHIETWGVVPLAVCQVPPLWNSDKRSSWTQRLCSRGAPTPTTGL